jgi:DNA-binding beta-propeller fold protein YncE
MRRTTRVVVSMLLAVATVGAAAQSAAAGDDDDRGHEVWAIDQSDTTPDGGGTLYVYRGGRLAGRSAASGPAEVIDLGGAARGLCLAETGSAPRRPHMLAFNEGQSHAIIAFVATGHVLFMDAAGRAPLRCIDVGVQAHAAFPSPDGTYVVVANQNGKLLQRIATDYDTNSFALDGAATLDLATCVTPSGVACQDPALRPDNAPICPVIDGTSRLTFVTLRGGGMFVVDSTATPMAIVGEYDSATVHPNGCGGLETAGKMYLNSGGGTPANPLESDLYTFPLRGFSTAANPPNTPAPALVFSHDARGFVDSHGTTLTKRARYLWVADRAANRIVVVDTRRDAVVNEIALAGPLSPDPAPDLMGISPDGKRVYVSLRGPIPLTANVPGVNNAVGNTPGVAILRVTGGGRSGRLHAVAPISHLVGGIETADPHGLAVRDTNEAHPDDACEDPDDACQDSDDDRD